MIPDLHPLLRPPHRHAGQPGAAPDGEPGPHAQVSAALSPDDPQGKFRRVKAAEEQGWMALDCNLALPLTENLGHMCKSAQQPHDPMGEFRRLRDRGQGGTEQG